MGMDVSAKLMYGTKYSDLVYLEELDCLLDEGDLDYASPYYDSPRSEWFVGIEVKGYQESEAALTSAVCAARKRFNKLTGGRLATIQVCPDVY